MLRTIAAILLGSAIAATPPTALHAQAPHDLDDQPVAGHEMWGTGIGGGWHLTGMAHMYPAATFAAPFHSGSPLHRSDFDLPHAAAMANVESPGAGLVIRLMPNFEGVTLPGGEVTFGTWGEGFIDSRHPHTLLHEAMVSLNRWDAPGGALSVSIGRGFAPYGTDDPMYRPLLKYPTNHHIAQVLERWTAIVAYAFDAGWGLEVGVFDGTEPEDPWDMSNFGDFANSRSGRVSRWFGGAGPEAPWEVSVSYGRVEESDDELTHLYNASLRHAATHGFGELYSLVALSRSDPRGAEGYFSILGEAELASGGIRPFARVEYATRPEYERRAPAGSDFFRYDHHDAPVGATRWLINSAGIGFDLTDLPFSIRPFVEASHHRVSHERGPQAPPGSLVPEDLFGASSFWTVSVGTRLFLGGGPMRMGRYGVLDLVSRMDHEAHPDMPADAHHH